MATDLEIEEWQNAYELQTIRVKQLESQLREKKSLLEAQDANVFQLEDLTKQLRSRLKDMADKTLKHQKIEKALDWLEARGIVEGGHFSHAAYLVRGVIQVFTHCEEELGNSDTDSENGSLVQFSVCSDQLEDYLVKLRALADVKRSPFTGHGDETWYDSILADSTVTGNNDVGNMKDSDRGSLKEEEIVERNDHLDVGSSQADDINVNLENEESHPSNIERKPSSIKEIQEPDQGVVDMDIRQLQQSLSREQERALHWQHLYLFERRQRERERESEEWEDERDREEWEKEWQTEREKMERSKADFTELECLKKILATNLTTLTQHVTKWNVSLFYDFANLSILLSSVQDLKQSVVDSISKVWDGAEEVLERMDTGSTGNAESFWDKDLVLGHYLLEVIDSIRQSSGPQLEMLLTKFRDNLEKIKQSFENMRDTMNSDSVAHWLEHALRVTEDMIVKLQNDVGKVFPESKFLMAYLKSIFDSLELKHEDEEIISSHKEEYGTQGQEQKEDDYEDLKSNDEEDDDDDDDYEYVKSDEEDEDEEEEDNASDDERGKRLNTGEEQGWSSGISSILSRTHRSFQQLGKKVRRTFGEIKTIWHKKDMPLIRIAKRLTSKFMRASVKLTKMCTKLPATLFRGNVEAKDVDQVLIYSKGMKKLRKRWQKQLLKNPCDTAGMLSPECNSDRKTLKKEMKEVSKLFSQLLRIKTFQPTEALKLSREDAALHHELFKSFLERWGGRSMLLKKDLEWAVCQREWWSQVLLARTSSSSEGNKVTLNDCDIMNQHENFFPGGNIEKFDKLKIKKQKHSKERIQNEEEDDKNEQKPVHYKRIGQELSKDQEGKMNVSEARDIADDEFSSDWYTEQAKYRLQRRRSKEKNLAQDNSDIWLKQRHNSENLSNKKKSQRVFPEDEDRRKNEWFFKKAQHREHQRDEHSRSEWLFERAKQRRYMWHRGDQEQDIILNGKRKYLKENWILKHGHYRQHQREEEHRADWVFDRAADRKEHHHSDLLGCNHQKKFRNGRQNDKGFRCAYGKVSSP